MTKQRINNILHHSEVSEKAIERYLADKAKKLGLPCLKYSNPIATGYPDRLIVLHSAKVVWVELKSEGCKPTKLQAIRHDELRAIGHRVEVIDSKAGVDDLFNSLTPEKL